MIKKIFDKKKLIIFLLGGILLVGLFGCSGSEVKDLKLVSYKTSISGGMTGGFWSVEIKQVGDEVIYIESNSDWWYEDDVIVEFKLDNQVLTEIEEVFKKNKMEKWKNKNFSNELILDGESHSYMFTFEEGVFTSFSSQTFPNSYGKVLNEISTIIDEYRSKGEQLPSLVVNQKSQEELTNINHPNNGLVKIEVYKYYTNTVCVRVLNGTDKDVNIEDSIRIVKSSDGEIIYERKTDNIRTIYSESIDEKYINISSRLDEGVYKLYFGEYVCEFEIKLQNDLLN